MTKKRVLCLLAPGFEEIEAITPVDLLRRAGADVVVAAVGGDRLVTGRSNVTVQADTMLGEVAGEEFDLLLIPGGPGVKTLREGGDAAHLARHYSETGKVVAAICAAPTVLLDAGLLAGRRFTAHFSVHGELPGVLADERVVEDGNLITSRGAGTALDFGLALVKRLYGDTAAREVEKAIMA